MTPAGKFWIGYFAAFMAGCWYALAGPSSPGRWVIGLVAFPVAYTAAVLVVETIREGTGD